MKDGIKRTGSYYLKDESLRKKLKLLAVEKGRTLSSVMEEAFIDILKKYETTK